MVPVYATAENAKTSVADESAGFLDRIVVNPDPGIYSGDFATWALNENWFVRGRHTCSGETLWGWWPATPKCVGHLFVQKTFQTSQPLSLDGGAKMKFRVSGKAESATEMYDWLVSQSSPIVLANDFPVELRDFHKLAEGNFILVQNEAQSEVISERSWLVLSITALIAALAAAGLALRWIYKKTPIAVNGAKAAMKGVQEIRVKRIAQDEVIRQTAREILANASEHEKKALRTQIQRALDSGDQDLAECLAAALKRIEKT